VAGQSEDLRQVPLFSSLNQRQLKRLARDLRESRFASGVTVVRQQEMSGVGFFIVVEGEASVGVDGSEVARLGPGDYFGELALISEQVRTATVTAATPMRCFVMTSWNFRRFVKDNPDVSWKLLQHLVALLAEERNRRSRAFLLTS